MATTQQLEYMTKDELYDLARDHEIEGRSNMDKDELVAALAEADGARPTDGEQTLDRPTTTGRSVWKGSITFGLITIPVGLYTAVEDRDISFHLLSAEDGSRIRNKRVSSETGEEVGWDDIVRGYEYEEGRYITFTHEELEQIPSDSLHTVDVVQFVPEDQLDPIGFERSYYVAPEESGIKAYALFVKALEESDKVGIAKVTLREKEHLCELWPRDGVLVLETMNWPDEIRVPEFEELEKTTEVSAQELEMAGQLIEQLTDDYDPTRLHDTYREKLQDAIETKIEGDEVHFAPETEEPAKVTDLMDTLRASVEATKERRSA